MIWIKNTLENHANEIKNFMLKQYYLDYMECITPFPRFKINLRLSLA